MELFRAPVYAQVLGVKSKTGRRTALKMGEEYVPNKRLAISQKEQRKPGKTAAKQPRKLSTSTAKSSRALPQQTPRYAERTQYGDSDDDWVPGSNNN